jgi:CheY-like chemotaxis protein
MKNELPAAPETVRILLIEDNAADVDLMRYALNAEHFRYELRTMKDGAEALAFIRGEGAHTDAKRPLRLIVMDLHLPKHDGLEILQELRSSAEFANLPVAFLSSSVSPEEKQRVAAFSGTCFITKPTVLKEFLKVGRRIKQLALDGVEECARAAVL